MTPDWPDLPTMDYRHGFPMPPVAADLVDLFPEDERIEFLAVMEVLTFEALTRRDIADVDRWLEAQVDGT